MANNTTERRKKRCVGIFAAKDWRHKRKKKTRLKSDHTLLIKDLAVGAANPLTEENENPQLLNFAAGVTIVDVDHCDENQRAMLSTKARVPALRAGRSTRAQFADG